MVIFIKKKWFTLFIASEPQLRNLRTKTTGAVGWDLWSKSTQVREPCLSFGCMRKGPWQFSILLFSCTPPYSYTTTKTIYINTITPIKTPTSQKTHSNKVKRPNVCFKSTFTHIFITAIFTAPHQNIKHFYLAKKTKSSLPPPNDLQQSSNQSQSIKSKTRQTRLSLINVNNTTLNNNLNTSYQLSTLTTPKYQNNNYTTITTTQQLSHPTSYQRNMLLILSYILKNSLAIQKDWCNDANLHRNGITRVVRPKGLPYIKISFLYMFLLISIFFFYFFSSISLYFFIQNSE